MYRSSDMNTQIFWVHKVEVNISNFREPGWFPAGTVDQPRHMTMGPSLVCMCYNIS